MSQNLTGRCLCGSVTYEIDGAAQGMGACHCSRCQRWTGVAHGTVLIIAPEQLRITTGEELITDYAEDAYAERSFCSQCGSSLFGGRDGMRFVLAGTVEGDPGVRPMMHIHVASKAVWHEITDDLPQFDGLPNF